MPLNIKLYEKLCLIFPKVKITNHMMPMKSHCGKIIYWGESYVVRCPFCDDKKYHLYISHNYLKNIPGLETFNLWKCFRRDCQNDYENRLALYKLICGIPDSENKSKPDDQQNCQSAVEKKNKKFIMQLLNLTDLPVSHYAVEYLINRKFDPIELERIWKVTYCHYHRGSGPSVSGRIVIPVIENKKIVGIQARACLDTQFPKYLTLFRKSEHVYGIHAIEILKNPKVIAIFEGVTDVWRFGPGGIAIFGKDLSTTQLSKIVSLIETYHIDRVVAIADGDDPQSYPKFCKIAKSINNALLRDICVCKVCPDGTDPADLTRHDLHKLVETQNLNFLESI